MNNKLKVGCLVVEIACMVGLGAMTLVSVHNEHKAKQELINTDAKRMLAEYDNFVKDREIRELKGKLEQYEPASEEKGEES